LLCAVFIQIMTVERKNTEILDQAHQMWAEGTSDVEPKANDIEKLLKDENWNIYDVDIWLDNMQGFWRWSCKIIRP
jgi:hypothetical protein